MDGKLIHDAVLLGDWKDVQAIPLSAITKRDADTEMLDGLIIRGYEMKWGATNENGERYEPNAFDEFISNYYVNKGLNVPIDVQHNNSPEWLAGRVVYLESNSVGFYVVGYIPRTFGHFADVKQMLENGILQGFSKFGWATDYEIRYTNTGEFDYELIKKCNLLAVSLVATPANGVPFERIDEAKRNALAFRNTIPTATGNEGRGLNDFFTKNKKQDE